MCCQCNITEQSGCNFRPVDFTNRELIVNDLLLYGSGTINSIDIKLGYCNCYKQPQDVTLTLLYPHVPQYA